MTIRGRAQGVHAHHPERRCDPVRRIGARLFVGRLYCDCVFRFLRRTCPRFGHQFSSHLGEKVVSALCVVAIQPLNWNTASPRPVRRSRHRIARVACSRIGDRVGRRAPYTSASLRGGTCTLRRSITATHRRAPQRTIVGNGVARRLFKSAHEEASTRGLCERLWNGPTLEPAGEPIQTAARESRRSSQWISSNPLERSMSSTRDGVAGRSA